MQRLCPACDARIEPGQRALAVVRGNASAAGFDGGIRELLVHASCWQAAELSQRLWSRVTEFHDEGRACADCKRAHWPCPVCGLRPVACGDRDGPCAECWEALDGNVATR